MANVSCLKKTVRPHSPSSAPAAFPATSIGPRDDRRRLRLSGNAAEPLIRNPVGSARRTSTTMSATGKHYADRLLWHRSCPRQCLLHILLESSGPPGSSPCLDYSRRLLCSAPLAPLTLEAGPVSTRSIRPASLRTFPSKPSATFTLPLNETKIRTSSAALLKLGTRRCS